MPTSGYWTQQQAADHYGVTDRTIRNWISKGLIPAYRVGPRRILVRRDDIENMMRVVPTTKVRGGLNAYGPDAKIVDLRNVVMDAE